MDLRRKLFLSTFIIILLSFNAQAAKVSISPQTQDVTSGNNITFSVILDPEGSSIYGAQFSLIFDKTIVEAIRIDKGALLGSDGAATIEAPKLIDNANGKITYSQSRSGTGTGMTSSGTLANVIFRGLNAGATAVTFTNIVLSDPNASEISGTASGGSVNVGASASTPTGTPTPTTNQTSTTTPNSVVNGSSSESDPSKKSNPAPTKTENNTLELNYPNNTVVMLSSITGVPEGNEFAVSVYVKSTESVYGAELKLSFDTDILEGVSLEQGQFLGGATIVNSVDNEKGEMAYAETRTGNVTGVKAKGILAKAVFRAKKAGVTTIQPEGIKLVNDDERIISNVLSDGINLTVLRTEKPPKGDAIGVYGALAALLSAALIIRKWKIK